MSKISCFPPVINKQSEILILGSMPGVRSLSMNQYYAHPQNSFWPIMGKLFNFDPQIAYSKRTKILLENKLALWDVVGNCQRQGSADQKIMHAQMNDFSTLFKTFPKIKKIFTDGQIAYKLFVKHYGHLGISIKSLPSTSPAYTKPVAWKLNVWKQLMAGHV